jgi:alkylation response protein AidB-like acyl-CoA dehydrogenase
MEIELTADQEFFRDTTKKFLDSKMPTTSVRELESNPDGFDREWWRQGAELGWTSMLVAEEFGGGSLSGKGLLDLVLVAEEMGRVVSPGPLTPVNLVASSVSAVGTAEQQRTLLPTLVSGESFASWAFFEGTGGLSNSSVQLQAERSGDTFVLTGVKSMVEAANVAENLLVTGRAPQGLTNFLVPVDTPGLTVTAMNSLDLVRRFSHVAFDHVTIPAAAVVGELGDAAAEVERLLEIAIVLQCHETNGATGRVFELTTDYASDRYAFGRPLNSYQALKHRFADMKLWLEGCHGIATHAARAVQAQASNAAELASAAKAYIGERATDIIQDCVQLHGGIGVTWEHDLHLYLRRATVNRLTYGTPAEHRDRIAAMLAI